MLLQLKFRIKRTTEKRYTDSQTMRGKGGTRQLVERQSQNMERGITERESERRR